MTGLSAGSSNITASVGSVVSNLSVVTVSVPGSIVISNLHEHSVVQTGFMVGTSTGVTTIGVQYDGGAIQTATGTLELENCPAAFDLPGGHPNT